MKFKRDNVNIQLNLKMDRFKEFVITEKVSKTQHKDALSDPNITFGMEFEYIDDNIANAEPSFDSGLGEEHDRISRELERIRNMVEPDREEWVDEMRDRKVRR